MAARWSKHYTQGFIVFVITEGVSSWSCCYGYSVLWAELSFFFYFTSAQIVLQAVLFHAKMPRSLLELFPLCTMSASGHASIIYDIDYIALLPRPNVHPGFLLVHFCRFEKWGAGPIYHKKTIQIT